MRARRRPAVPACRTALLRARARRPRGCASTWTARTPRRAWPPAPPGLPTPWPQIHPRMRCPQGSPAQQIQLPANLGRSAACSRRRSGSCSSTACRWQPLAALQFTGLLLDLATRSSRGPWAQAWMSAACMRAAQEREPQRLLRPLTEGLARRGVPCQHALFVPPDSSYSKLGPRAGPPDMSWQAQPAAPVGCRPRAAAQRSTGARSLGVWKAMQTLSA